MSNIADIEQVKHFWNQNPLLVGEISEIPGSLDFFNHFDKIKCDDVLGIELINWVSTKIKNKVILDIGCGPGFWSRQVNAFGGIYTGIDISEAAVSLTNSSIQMMNHTGMARLGNAEALDFESNSFDYIISEGVIHHTPNTQECINEIYRVLKPGGEAVVSVYYRNLLLRHHSIFVLTRSLLKMADYRLSGRGRERMLAAETVEEFVRMYDGEHNPIGKCYTKKNALAMLKKFEVLKLYSYYLPYRAWRFPFPRFLHSLLASYFGTMLFFHIRKPK